VDEFACGKFMYLKNDKNKQDEIQLLLIKVLLFVIFSSEKITT